MDRQFAFITPLVGIVYFKTQISGSRKNANIVVRFTSCMVKVLPKVALKLPWSIPASGNSRLDNTQIKILGQSFRLSESGFSMMDLTHYHIMQNSLVVILVRTRPFGTTIL